MPLAPRESETRPGTILQRGRAKAYRPLPPERRAEILAEGLAAYDRGDFFLAHELLEPAWMGASDPAERDLYQGLIKLAAAFVLRARGNPTGVHKNLLGARARLAEAVAPGRESGLDVERLVAEIDRWLAGTATAGGRSAEARAGGPRGSADGIAIVRLREGGASSQIDIR